MKKCLFFYTFIFFSTIIFSNEIKNIKPTFNFSSNSLQFHLIDNTQKDQGYYEISRNMLLNYQEKVIDVTNSPYTQKVDAFTVARLEQIYGVFLTNVFCTALLGGSTVIMAPISIAMTVNKFYSRIPNTAMDSFSDYNFLLCFCAIVTITSALSTLFSAIMAVMAYTQYKSSTQNIIRMLNRIENIGKIKTRDLIIQFDIGITAKQADA